NVSVIDLRKRREVCHIPVQREPVAAALTRDGKFLLAANHLPAVRADQDNVAAVVSVIDTKQYKVVKEIKLPSGSGSLHDISVSPDGKYAVVTHTVSSFNWSATQIIFGWIHANALTIIDLEKMKIRYTVSLDEPDRGAADPWGTAWSSDGKILAVAHAGTHEVSIIDFPKLLANLPDAAIGPGQRPPVNNPVLTFVSRNEGIDNVLPFLTGARERIKLPPGNLGPRALAIVGRKLYVANHYSDTINVINLDSPRSKIETIDLCGKQPMDIVQKGDFYFHDADICFQGWQSCSSCHPGDARSDGFDWDLPAELGFGNPRHTKSLLLTYKTSGGSIPNGHPAPTISDRIKFLLFTNQPPDVSAAIDAYLKSLKPVPSPYLIRGNLSDAARRGEKLFQAAQCASCHIPGLYTDSRLHDVGTRTSYDETTGSFSTPTLVEVWRTAPYLHDGSAVTIRDVLTTRNPLGKHGDISHLNDQQIHDLCQYVLSL
ncbi:MAG TPA: c-type cytochrome, partial [Verrucomicrobiae bacterium]|nr:c-type cytochrome [Verrucomicrobiae bacterium]